MGVFLFMTKRIQYNKYHSDYAKKYRLTCKGYFLRLKSHAKGRGVSFLLDYPSFEYWRNKQKNICSYCKRTLKEILSTGESRANILSVDSVDNKKGYQVDNIVLACNLCNWVKKDFFNYNDMLRLGRIIRSISNRILKEKNAKDF